MTELTAACEPLDKKQDKLDQNSRKFAAVADYVDEHLILLPSAKLLRKDVHKDFFLVTEIDERDFNEQQFDQALKRAIAAKGPDWQGLNVCYYNGRDGSGRPGKACKGMLWKGIAFKDPSKMAYNKRREWRVERYEKTATECRS